MHQSIPPAPRMGHLPSFCVPTVKDLTARVPTPRNLPSKAKKNANAPTPPPPSKEGGWAQVELTDALIR